MSNQKMTILLLEDDASLSLLLSEELELDGYKVIRAETVDEGYRQLSASTKAWPGCALKSGR